jgi:hypothetical protein
LAFYPSRNRSVPRSPRSTPAFAVGQRVFVDSTGNPSGSVALGDERGNVLSAVTLADGVEVEVLAWRPRGAGGTRYRVRVPDGAGGWLPADNLRRTAVPLPAPEPPTPAQATTTADANARPFGQRSHTKHPSSSEPITPAEPAPVIGGGRRFGQHFETEHPPASGSPTSAEPAPVVDGGGRRFGQHF